MKVAVITDCNSTFTQKTAKENGIFCVDKPVPGDSSGILSNSLQVKSSCKRYDFVFVMMVNPRTLFMAQLRQITG